MSTNDYTAYLAHFGTKGQRWGLRKQQSYQVAPTRSGMIGQEVGEAAKQAARLIDKQEYTDFRSGNKFTKERYELSDDDAKKYYSPSKTGSGLNVLNDRGKKLNADAAAFAKREVTNERNKIVNYNDLQKYAKNRAEYLDVHNNKYGDMDSTKNEMLKKDPHVFDKMKSSSEVKDAIRDYFYEQHKDEIKKIESDREKIVNDIISRSTKDLNANIKISKLEEYTEALSVETRKYSDVLYRDVVDYLDRGSQNITAGMQREKYRKDFISVITGKKK